MLRNIEKEGEDKFIIHFVHIWVDAGQFLTIPGSQLSWHNGG